LSRLPISEVLRAAPHWLDERGLADFDALQSRRHDREVKLWRSSKNTHRHLEAQNTPTTGMRLDCCACATTAIFQH
jgi:hypothetical protein